MIKLCPWIWHYGVLPTICWLLLIFLILHLKINSQSRRKIGTVYTYSNIPLCSREGRRFGSSHDGSSQLWGKLLTGERERPRIDSKLSPPITESGHKLKRIRFVPRTAVKHGGNFLFLFFISLFIQATLFLKQLIYPPSLHDRQKGQVSNNRQTVCLQHDIQVKPDPSHHHFNLQ